ncbi:MAG: tetratricopeptide repeat protein [Actinomycetota bacterium]|nr:tetratricopeptide repeat protein [Actinomycetota bacterium]
MSSHLHVVGARERDRQQYWDRPDQPILLARCHRRLRGPYTGVDTLLAAILPDALERCPQLVAEHRLELLSSIPELHSIAGPPPATLASQSPFEQRTRFFSTGMVRCLNHGIVTFLRQYATLMRAAGQQLPILVFDGLSDAELTTQEFVALFLRRIPPELWAITVGSGGNCNGMLTQALADYAERVEVSALPPRPGGSLAERAAAFVASDGTSDDSGELAAYQQLDPVARILLHDQRADELGATEGPVNRFTLCYHRQRGSDPDGLGVAAALATAEYCTSMGFSASVLEYAQLGRTLADPERDSESYRKLTHLLIAALITVNQTGEAAALCRELRHRYASPLVHMITSYLFAMINTRFSKPRDHETAVEWQNNAIVIASLLPEEHQRLVMTGFHENGMALIEMHRGNLDTALALVDGAIARLDKHLGSDSWVVHRSQLLYNRTRLVNAMGRREEAYQGFSKLIEMDPYYTDYFYERAKVSRKRGDLESALEDYDLAIEMGPPFAEVFHNRGSLHLELGNVELALADFDFVVDMEPDDCETRLSRAELLFELDQLAAAAADLEHGLALLPDEPRMLCLRGMIRLAAGSPATARQDFDASLAVDPDYPAGLVNRAVAHYQLAQPAAAADDLTRALALVGDDPDLLLNRGLAYAAQGATDLAVSDYDHALALPDADLGELRFQRGSCLVAAGRSAASFDDLQAAIALDHRAAEAAQLLAG